MSVLTEFITEKNSIIANLFQNKSNYSDALMDLNDKTAAMIPRQRALNYDPLQVLDFFEYKSKPIGLSYDFLKMIADRDPLVSAIISTRLSQLSLFSRPKFLSRSKFGYSLYPITTEVIKEPEKKVIRELELFLYNGGFYPDYNRVNFPAFLKAIIRDRFRYDQVNFEIVWDTESLKMPVAFYPVDASTIRRYSQKEITPQKTYYQRITSSPQDRIDFGFKELAWCVFFPRTDIENFGFGVSEIEQILNILAARIYADEYNANYLKRGISKGLLWAKRSTISRSKMQSLREEISAGASGWYHAHRIPFISSPEIENLQYIPLDKSLRDMEFGKYLDYLLNLSCAVFQIDPAEINFPNRGNFTGAIVQTEGSQEVKIKFSRDKGLRPLLMFIEDFINQYLIFPITNMEWCFAFYGLDDLSEKEIIEKKYREVTAWKTVNEIRSEADLPPVEGGDIILNSMFLQLFQQANMNLQTTGVATLPQLKYKESSESSPSKPENKEKLTEILNRIIGKTS